MECLYCTIAFITFISNTLYAVLSIRNLLCRNRPAITSCLIYHGSCSVPSDPNVEVLTVLAVYIIIPSAVFAELLVSVLVVKNNFYDQRRWSTSFLEAVSSAGFSCVWIVEYSGSYTTHHHDCNSHLCTSIRQPTSDCPLQYTSANNTCQCDTHCCLPAVSLSAAKKEKSILQCKELWTKVCAVNCDDCNPRTNYCTYCFI